MLLSLTDAAVLIAAKILTTFLTVVMLASVARRLGAAWAGVLAGFPLGSAITLYFIGYEQGAEFAATGAVHTLIGLIGCLVMASTYFLLSQRFPQPRQILLPALGAPLAFLGCAALLQYWQGSLLLNLLVIVAAILLVRQTLRRVADHPVRPNPDNLWQRPLPAILFRATAATLSVLGITALAHWLTPAQAGLLSAFPVSFYPTLIVLQLSYGAPVVATTVRQYPEGLGAMVVYVIAVTWSYPALGVNTGTAVALAAAIVYLALYSALRRTGKAAT